MPRVIHVAEIQQTCDSCPSQWEGKTVEGDDLYIRYRHNTWRIDLNERTLVDGTTRRGQDDGTCTLEEICEWSSKLGVILVMSGEDVPPVPSIEEEDAAVLENALAALKKVHPAWEWTNHEGSSLKGTCTPEHSKWWSWGVILMITSDGDWMGWASCDLFKPRLNDHVMREANASPSVGTAVALAGAIIGCIEAELRYRAYTDHQKYLKEGKWPS